MAPKVVKLVDGAIEWVQIRRIACSNCDEPFSYLFHEVLKRSDAGVRFVSSTEALHAQAVEMAIYGATTAATGPVVCEVNCPHCGRGQGTSQLRAIKNPIIGGVVIGFWLAVFAALGLSDESVSGGTFAAVTAFGVLGGAGVGYAIGVSRLKPEGTRDRRVKTDDQLYDLLELADGKRVDAATYWLRKTMAVRPSRDADGFVDLGVQDDVGGIDLDPDETTVARIEAVRARLAYQPD